jgi:hypothetical protein
MTFVELCSRLQALCPYSLSVRIHDNRSTYASVKRIGCRTIDLSIHRLFLYSSTPVLEALIRFALHKDSRAKAMIRQMAHLYFTQIEPPAPNPALSDPQGKNVDLQVIYDQLNKSLFGSEIQVPIAWFDTPRYRTWRRITFGSFDRTIPLIRINRLLDCCEVPLLFVEFIVYHEMLHAVCETRVDLVGRLWVHTPEFRRREALHPHYALAKKWEKQSLKFFKGLSWQDIASGPILNTAKTGPIAKRAKFSAGS